MKRVTIRRRNGVTLAPGWDFCIDPEDYDLVQKLLARLAAYEDTGLEPSEIKRNRKMSPMDEAEMRAKASHVKDLLVAETEGRLLVLDEETALALAAVIRGCNSNRKLVGASFLWDFRGLMGGPKQITYFRAIEKLHGIADTALEQLMKGF